MKTRRHENRWLLGDLSGPVIPQGVPSDLYLPQLSFQHLLGQAVMTELQVGFYPGLIPPPLPH